ncbi:MAG: MerR family transcriptional regulator [Gammaproteobacteria bacterium]|jgi:chaperone modulatory protein CbpM|nr:MerR family transcriptional regulator [Gammaproteobacteria bacterium]
MSERDPRESRPTTTREITGFILEENTRLGLGELSSACAVQADYIIELVEAGVIEPVSYRRRRWQFTGESLTRARRAVALQRDLGLNLEGAALALDLLDELDRLRARLRAVDSES